MSLRPTRKQLGWCALLASAALLAAFALFGARTAATEGLRVRADSAGARTAQASLLRQQQSAFWRELARVAHEEEAARVARDAADREVHPHPISADHQRLYRDVDLLHAADEAISQQRYADARRLLEQHHTELPGMSPVEEEGLMLLVDCAEQRSPAHVARVQDFYDRNSASTVRRRLRRACLERAR